MVDEERDRRRADPNDRWARGSFTFRRMSWTNIALLAAVAVIVLALLLMQSA